MRWRLSPFKGYLISSCGKIWSCKSKKLLKPYKHPEGYLLVSFSIEGKNYKRYVHRIVAESFIPNKENLKEVNHIDGDKTNNDVNNLEYITRSGNVLHAYKLGLAKSKLCEEDVLSILQGNETVKEKALKYNCSEENIRGILSGRNWRHLQ